MIKREKGLNVLSLFDGMSCGHIALNRASIKVNTYIASEIEKSVVKVTQANYPNTLMVGNVELLHYVKRSKKLYSNCKRTLIDSLKNHKGKKCWTKDEIEEFQKQKCQILANGDVIKFSYNHSNLVFEGDIDLILAGSPCTNFSSAAYYSHGKVNYGLEGQQSKLFYEFYRILHEVNPKFYLLENVASMTKESKEILNSFLHKRAILINSNLVSYQNRERLYWTNIPNVNFPKDLGIDFQNYKITTIKRVEKLLYAQKYEGDTIPIILTATEVDTIYNKNLWAYNELKQIRATLTKEEFVDEIHKMLKESCCAKMPYREKMIHGDSKGRFKTKNATNATKIACVTTSQNRTPCCGYVEFGSYIRVLTRLELAKAQTVPYSYVCNMTTSNLEKALGNGWTIEVIVHILKKLKKQYEF